ncbi:MAG TPA: hypothetical protein VN706_19590 [Gemmatimonadaceae bacterium]|nr:hypothetical protein [Gemmatimonadaceae bacterium]
MQARPHTVGAQVPVRPDTVKKRDTILVPIPQRADSILRDTLAKKDSLHPIAKDTIRPDTIKAPIAHAEMPTELAIGRSLHWDRDSLFATGALTLADLLERVPGLTSFHSGWLPSPATDAYMGDIRRVRVFIDGLEYLGLDPRNHGALDLTQVNLWGMEEATIEPTASEVRVYLRTWRQRNTHPETRTDVSTGDQATTMYRGFYGKRLNHGEDIQFGAQQNNAGNPAQVLGGSGTQTGTVARLGWAKPNFSVDGFLSHISRTRDLTRRDPGVGGDSMPNVASSRTDMYFRVGYADPDTSHLWLQAMAGASKYDYTGVRTDSVIAFPKTAADTAFNNQPLDTSTYRSQYLITGGTVRGPLRVSLTERLLSGGGKSINSPSARGSFAWGPFGVSAFTQAKDLDSISRSDVTAQFNPLPFVSVLASAGRSTDSRIKDSSFTASYLRAEAGVRYKNLWFLGGILKRDSASLTPPNVYDTTFARVGEAPVTGATAAIRGQVWRLIHIDAWAVRWNDTLGYYRPRYQTRTELYVHTNMLDRFPSGHLGIMASLIHEYRSNVRFPVGVTTFDNGATVSTTNVVPSTALGYRTISTLLEIRILTATISWQFRNVLGERYSQVPGFLMPRQTNFYGVRWSFVD